MTRTVAIDACPGSASKYRDTHAIVAVDVFRATTTIITALAGGRRVYPVATIEEAERIAATLETPLLAGELAGVQPDGFELNNSPSAIAARADRRPIVLISSAGTQLLAQAAGARAVYVACLRNLSATARYLAQHERRVCIIGAGTRGEPRAEDQLACAWLAARMLVEGFEAETDEAAAEIMGSQAVSIGSIRESPSADYLRRTQQEADIEFVLSHLDDRQEVALADGPEVRLVGSGDQLAPGAAVPVLA